jgi:hypothetical protein
VERRRLSLLFGEPPPLGSSGRTAIRRCSCIQSLTSGSGEWLAAHPHVLVVAPDLYAGLIHEQLDVIEAWL